MARDRVIRTTFTDAEPFDSNEGSGAVLGFRPQSTRFETDRVESRALLGPTKSAETVHGLGQVVRILRAARISVPRDPTEWIGRDVFLLGKLARAVGTALLLGLRPRTTVRFTAWLEEGVQVIDDVAEVIEGTDSYTVRRQTGRFPVLVPRRSLLRHQTESHRWFEVLSIERAP